MKRMGSSPCVSAGWLPGRTALRLADEHGLHSLAMPAISCGVYRFPIDEAAAITVRTLSEELPARPGIERVVLAFIDRPIEAVFRQALLSVLSRGQR
jgi:O-acetyl-ADP-ribose deacetylase (regulator of RNase III)